MSSDTDFASEIIAPVNRALVIDRSSGNGKAHVGPPVCYDPDGRRRILVTGDQLKRLDRVLADMTVTGQTVIMVCRETFRRADGTKSCGQPMFQEVGPDGPRFACLCTRIHVVK